MADFGTKQAFLAAPLYDGFRRVSCRLVKTHCVPNPDGKVSNLLSTINLIPNRGGS